LKFGNPNKKQWILKDTKVGNFRWGSLSVKIRFPFFIESYRKKLTKPWNKSKTLVFSNLVEKPYPSFFNLSINLNPGFLETLLPYSGENGKYHENKVNKVGVSCIQACVLRFILKIRFPFFIESHLKKLTPATGQ
jgi:hypothetical protein